MPVRSDPARATAKWVSGMQGATEAMKAGVAAVQDAPGARAAAAADKWLMNTTNSKDKFIRRVRAVTKEDWQRAMNDYGIGRVGTGAAAKKDKMQAFLTDFLPYLKEGADQVARMPKVTLSDSGARMLAMMEHNAKYQRKG